MNTEKHIISNICYKDAFKCTLYTQTHENADNLKNTIDLTFGFSNENLNITFNAYTHVAYTSV